MTSSRSTRQQTRRPRRVELPEAISVAHLADQLGLSPIDLIKQLMRGGVMASMNQTVDFETASSLCHQFGRQAVRIKPASEQDAIRTGRAAARETLDTTQVVTRPPVVTILGHVDHGKTTLLDAIRESNVVAREAGGITQSIGAYRVEYNGQRITFVDTPGHEAFTAMRARGALVTDVAVLVIAADDGVMPQTVEAINHARAAEVPIVVAINKVDKAGADQERVKRQLAEQELLVEEWGGEVVAVPISAKQREGLNELLENLLVVAELEDLKASVEGKARGAIIEAQLTRGKGVVATALVQSGTLRQGDHVVVGEQRARVKAMFNEAGKRVRAATPSTPVSILGLPELPQAGEILEGVESEQAARSLVEERTRRRDAERRGQLARAGDMRTELRSEESQGLNLIVKTEVQGTVDAVRGAVAQLGTNDVAVKVLHASSGSITEGDVLLALASNGLIVSFGARPETGARRVAEQEGVEIRYYDVIYHLVEDLERLVKGMALPDVRDAVDGHAEVRALFPVGRRGRAAGVYVTDGQVVRNGSARVLRGREVIADEPIRSLRHYKDDVRQLAAGTEGGVALERFTDFREGDVLESHHRERVER